MPVKVQVTCEQQERALRALETLDTQIVEPELQAAAEKTVAYLTKDLKGGVGSLTGELRSAIGGEVRQVVGSDVEMLVRANPSHGGYNYAARLDKDGSMRWRRGKWKGRRTFGWFSYVLQRIGPRAGKRYMREAIKKITARLVRATG